MHLCTHPHALLFLPLSATSCRALCFLYAYSCVCVSCVACNAGSVERRWLCRIYIRGCVKGSVCGGGVYACVQWVHGASRDPSKLVQKCSCGNKHAPNGISKASEVPPPPPPPRPLLSLALHPPSSAFQVAHLPPHLSLARSLPLHVFVHLRVMTVVCTREESYERLMTTAGVLRLFLVSDCFQGSCSHLTPDHSCFVSTTLPSSAACCCGYVL